MISADLSTAPDRDRRSRPGRRIALVFNGFNGGGMERSMLRLAEELIGRGFGVDFVVEEAKGELLGEVPRSARIVKLDEVQLTRWRARGLAADPGAWWLLLQPRSRIGGLIVHLKTLLRQLPSVVGYFRKVRPDAVLAAEPKFNLLTVWARRLSGLRSRVVVSEHTQVSRHAALDGLWSNHHLHLLLRRAYLKADAIVAVSDGVANDLASYAGIPRDRITTAYYPVVGPDLLAKAGEPLDHPWFAAGQPPVVLGAGRLDPQKDFATLIRAFARVRARRPARLMILGAAAAGSEHAARLTTLASELGIGHDVAMPGFAHNPLAFMSRSSVFVLSSTYEGLGVVVIEALACGTPVVSTDCPSGPREILDHGRFGPLVPVGDDAALAGAIETVLDDPPPSERLRGRAELFRVDRAVDNYLRLLYPHECLMAKVWSSCLETRVDRGASSQPIEGRVHRYD
jgi:glycosyltransferase involved in cell wall biosynthesis